jgi:hypothetical protein
MSKARNLADLLGADGDVKASALDNVSSDGAATSLNGYTLEVVATTPSSPAANTIYLVQS